MRADAAVDTEGAEPHRCLGWPLGAASTGWRSTPCRRPRRRDGAGRVGARARRRQPGARICWRPRAAASTACAPRNAASPSKAGARSWRASARRCRTSAAAWKAALTPHHPHRIPAPPTSARRARARRCGSWSTSRPSVGDAERAGLEAACEASGLLDAWLAPDGRLQAGADGKPILDVQALAARAVHGRRLATMLQAAVPDDCRGAAPLPSRPCSRALPAPPTIPATARPGSRPTAASASARSPGAWTKPEPVYIGFAARAAARARRLAAIAERLAQLAAELAEAASGRRAAGARRSAGRRGMAAGARRRRAAAARMSSPRAGRANSRPRASGSPQADIRYRTRSRRCDGAQRQLVADAADLHLPTAAAALPGGRGGAGATISRRRPASAMPGGELRQALPELARQRQRAQDALDDLQPLQRALCGLPHRGRGGGCAPGGARARRSAPRSRSCSASCRRRAPTSTADEARLKAANAALRDCGESARRRRSRKREAAARPLRGSAARSAPRPSPSSSASRPPGLLQAAWPEAPLPDLRRQLDHRPRPHIWRAAPSRRCPRSGRRRRLGPRAEAGRRRLDRAAARRSARAATRRRPSRATAGLVVHILYQGRPERPDRLAAAARRGDRAAQRAADRQGAARSWRAI